MIQWKCRQCEAGMEAPDGLIGEFLKCPQCNTRQEIPEPPRTQLARQRELAPVAESSITSADGQQVIAVSPPVRRIKHPKRLAGILASGLITTGIIITLLVQAFIPDPSRVPDPGASKAVVQRHCEWVIAQDLESRIYDPDSLDIVQFTDAFRVGDTFFLGCSYRARNGFGAMMLFTQNWTIIRGQVVSVE